MNPNPSSIPHSGEVFACEIAADVATANELSAIVRMCAKDVDQPLALRRVRARRTGAAITFHLPTALVFEYDRAWRLAGRVACFCPEAQVSVVIEPHTIELVRSSIPAGAHANAA